MVLMSKLEINPLAMAGEDQSVLAEGAAWRRVADVGLSPDSTAASSRV